MKTKFINPYNFIPLGKQKTVYKSEQNKKGLTGEISYSLMTRTPLFIPNTETVRESKEVKGHKIYQFFSGKIYDDTLEKEIEVPIIPGSEIRGMFRSYFEILSNSCMSALDSDTQLSKRTSEVFKPGLLKKVGDRFVLYEAESLRYQLYSKYETIEDAANLECTKIFFRKKRIESVGRNGKPQISYMAEEIPVGKVSQNQGYLVIGNQGGSTKKWSHIIALKNGLETQVEGAECIDIRMLEKILKEYKNNTDAYDNYAAAFWRFKAGKGEMYFPVYYSIIKAKENRLGAKEKTMIFLSPAAITREMYHNTIGDCAGSYKTCEKEENCCPSCALFGMVGKAGEAIASRLRFSDLHCEKIVQENLYLPMVTLRELSSPKLNNMEFYLKRPKDAWFWTYDYYIDSEGTLYWHTPELNGRKFYWHAPQAANSMSVYLEAAKQTSSVSENPQHDAALKQMYEALIDPKTNRRENNRNVTAQLLDRGNTFHGTVYFKNISEKELKQLVWLLNAGEYVNIADKQYGYKLGAGKALGLGSVSVCVDAVKIRVIEKMNGEITISYKTLEKETDGEFIVPKIEECFAKEDVENFQKASEFLAVEERMEKKTGNCVGVDGKGTYNTCELSYPYVKDKTDEGYKWFVSNHKAYGLNKKTGENEMKKLPNSRKQMVFMNYLEALEPKVKETAKELSAMLENMNKGNQQYNRNQGNRTRK